MHEELHEVIISPTLLGPDLVWSHQSYLRLLLTVRHGGNQLVFSGEQNDCNTLLYLTTKHNFEIFWGAISPWF